MGRGSLGRAEPLEVASRVKGDMMQGLRVYLQLMRFPAVFTAMADVFLGFLLTHRELAPASTFGLLLAASSCLYLSGMVLNDVFDRRIDAVERPGRPIPSGRVSVKSAAALGAALIAAGIGFAAFAGESSLKIALSLAAAILLYDGLLKNTAIGPVAMGACRFLNVMLGSSATFFVWATPQLYVAPALGLYIAGVTWFSRGEAGRSGRRSLSGAAAVINVGLAGLALLFAIRPGEARWPGSDEPDPTIVMVLFGIAALMINRRVRAAILDPTAARVQHTVKGCLLSLILLDATVVFYHTGRADLGLMIAALAVPSWLLSRWLYVT